MSDASAIVGTPDGPNVFLPSFASYNWIGSPSNYDLTTNAATGGDSDLENVNKWFQSGDQAYIIVASAMVSQNLGDIPNQMDTISDVNLGLDNGTRSGFPLLWSCTKKVRFVIDVGVYDCWISRHVPMVLLGFLTCVLRDWHQWLYW